MQYAEKMLLTINTMCLSLQSVLCHNTQVCLQCFDNYKEVTQSTFTYLLKNHEVTPTLYLPPTNTASSMQNECIFTN